VIGLDVSGSMSCPVTGGRGKGATSKMRCVDVAALVAAAFLRRTPAALSSRSTRRRTGRRSTRATRS